MERASSIGEGQAEDTSAAAMRIAANVLDSYDASFSERSEMRRPVARDVIKAALKRGDLTIDERTHHAPPRCDWLIARS